MSFAIWVKRSSSPETIISEGYIGPTRKGLHFVSSPFSAERYPTLGAACEALLSHRRRWRRARETVDCLIGSLDDYRLRFVVRLVVDQSSLTYAAALARSGAVSEAAEPSGAGAAGALTAAAEGRGLCNTPRKSEIPDSDCKIDSESVGGPMPTKSQNRTAPNDGRGLFA